MPGMPIFQDSPSQLKGQIYVLNSANQSVVPLQVDNDGNLSVDLAAGSEVTLAPGAEVTLAAGTDINNVDSVTTITNDVKVVNGATPLEVELPADIDIDTVNTVTTITDDVKIVNGATPLTVGLAAGTEVTLAAGADIDNVDSVTTLDTITNDVKIINGGTPLTVGLDAGTNVIGKVENQLVFTNVDSFGGATPLEPMNVGISATVTSDPQDVSQESSYNWFIRNTGTDSSDQDITLKVEISPDGINWLEDTGSTITVPFNTSKIITVTHFLQYVRFVITGGAAATTVISCFQAQH
jgi:hypothetical protein